MRLLHLLVLLLAGINVGCSDVQQGPPPPPPAETAKSYLNSLSKTGQLDSGMVLLQDCASQMKATDPQKAADLEKGIQELNSLRAPDAIKNKAKEIAAKL